MSLSICSTNHKYADFNLPAWFECIVSNKSYGEFPKLYYTSFYEMPEILVDVREFCNTFSFTSTSRVRGGDWGVYLNFHFTLGIH